MGAGRTYTATDNEKLCLPAFVPPTSVRFCRKACQIIPKFLRLHKKFVRSHQRSAEEVGADPIRAAVVLAEEDGHFVGEHLHNRDRTAKGRAHGKTKGDKRGDEGKKRAEQNYCLTGAKGKMKRERESKMNMKKHGGQILERHEAQNKSSAALSARTSSCADALGSEENKRTGLTK